jgi:hypothetical protein
MSEIINIPMAGFALRVTSALILTFAASYMVWQFHKGNLRPRPIWIYVTTITVLTAVWRWIVVLLANGDLFPVTSNIMADWITPISASLYALSGVSLIAIAVACSRRRRGDG